MIKISCIENFVEKDYSHFSTFVIEPLETGQAITLGNALRRALLSDLVGYNIQGIRINDIKNEYSLIPAIREDSLEILLNFKEVLFKESVLLHEKTKSVKNFILPAFISETGPKVVTAGMLKLPYNTLMVLNPEEYICTIVKPSDFFCEVDIALSQAYQSTEDIKDLYKEERFLPGKPKTLFLDTAYGPVQKVSFKVKLTYDSQGNLKEALYLDITTRGTKTPKRCLNEGVKCLMSLFYPLLADPFFLNFKSKMSQDFSNDKCSISDNLVTSTDDIVPSKNFNNEQTKNPNTPKKDICKSVNPKKRLIKIKKK